MTSQVVADAAAAATRAVVGSRNRVWAAEIVMTPVMVPGLAANKIKGVSDGLVPEGAEVDPDPGVLPLSMANPIQASTPPPATMKASRDTPPAQ